MTTRNDDQSYRHRGGSKPLIGKTIDAHFRSVCATHPSNEAVVSMAQATRLTYRELDHEIQRVARGLVALGLGRGSRLGIWSTDNVEWLLVQMATARIGAVLVNINPAYRRGELEHALTLARVQALVLIPSFRSSDYVGMIRTLCPELETADPDSLESAKFPALKRVVVYDPDAPTGTRRPAPGFLTWQALLARGEGVEDEDVERRSAALDPDDPINIQFTSGTTGFPKAVILTHHNILNNGYFVGEAMNFGPADRLCVPVPFYHCFGMVVSNLGCLAHGSTLVIPAPHFEVGATLHALEAERCTAIHGVPTMFVAELEELRRKRYDLSHLRTGIMAGAPCPPELVRRVMEEMGCREILIGYGQTEASPVTHCTKPDDSFERRVESVGTNLPHQEVKVVDTETGAIVAVGQTGELCFRGYHVMRGYFDNPEATATAIDEAGWLHSGDLGELDADGYLKITGRLKDMIIRGGENIYPAEIEAQYFTHPDIAQLAVFGIPDDKMGEEVAMWVMLHPDANSDVETLRAWGRERMAHFKIPRHIWIVEEFPMTVTGKIQKFRMREMTAELLRAEAAADGQE